MGTGMILLLATPPMAVADAATTALLGGAVEISVKCGSNRSKHKDMLLPHDDETIVDVHDPVLGQRSQALSSIQKGGWIKSVSGADCGHVRLQIAH